MLRGLKVNFKFLRFFRSLLSQTGMKGHYKAECLEKQKLTVMVIMGWFERRPPAGSGAVQVIPGN